MADLLVEEDRTIAELEATLENQQVKLKQWRNSSASKFGGWGQQNVKMVASVLHSEIEDLGKAIEKAVIHASAHLHAHCVAQQVICEVEDSAKTKEEIVLAIEKRLKVLSTQTQLIIHADDMSEAEKHLRVENLADDIVT